MEVIQLFQHPALPCGVKLSTPITVAVVKFLPSPTPGNVSKPIAGMNFPGGGWHIEVLISVDQCLKYNIPSHLKKIALS